MEKRNLFSYTMTAILLLLLNPLFLTTKPTDFNMEIKGKDEIGIQVLLDETESQSAKTDLLKTDKASILVLRKNKFEKITINLSGAKGEISITNVNLRNGKYKLDNPSHFEVEGAYSKIINNSLILIPESEKITLNYLLEGKPPIRFRFEIFVSILILSLLLSKKFTSYLLDFKANSKASSLDIIFVTIFFIALLIPVFNMNKDGKTGADSSVAIENYDYGKQAMDWFRAVFNKININIKK